MRFEKFENIITDITSKYFKINKELYLPEGDYKIIDQGKDFIGGFTNDKSLVVNNPNPVIIFGDHTKALKYIDFPFVIGADGVKVLQINQQKAFSKYVYYFLKTVKIQDAGYSRHFKFLKAVKIPIPEKLEDQIRIATLLSKAETLIKQRKESIDLLDEYLKSTFLEMFGDPVRNEKEWNFSFLGKISEFENGDRSSSYPSGDEVIDNGIIFVNSKNIFEFRFRPVNPNFISIEKFDSLRSGKCKKGDILFTLRGNGLGKCCVFNGIYENGFVNAQIVIIRPNMKVNPYFLIEQFRNPSIFQNIWKLQSGSAQPQLSVNQLKNLQIICPPVELQNQYVNIVEKTESLKAQYKSSLAELENLYGSLSQKAFKGELNMEKGEDMLMAAEPEEGYGRNIIKC